jgi:maltose O-acetyltransferase
MGLVVGKNFRRMHGTILDPSHCWLIHIGDDVTFAPRCHVLAHDASTCHHLGYARIGNVIIGNNVFIGAETVILPGVTIGDNVVIGANSTVSRDIPSNSVAVGSPARVVGDIQDYIKRNKALMESRPCYGEEYTLRQAISQEKKTQMFNDLKDGVGFVI